MNFITATELKKMIDDHEEFVLLDCRGRGSFEAEHIVTAQNILWSDIPALAPQKLPDKTTLIVTSCSSMTCDASEKCYAELEKLGYTNLREFPGGLVEWVTRGFETVKLTQPV